MLGKPVPAPSALPEQTCITSQVPESLTRRKLLKTGVSAFAAASLAPSAESAATMDAADRAKQTRSIPYGAAISSVNLARDKQYGEAIARYCDLVVPDAALKWDATRPSPDRFDFTDADMILKFASENKIGVRGHTLVWYAALPKWIDQAVTSRESAERELTHHIAEVVGRYRGTIGSWDVVNEPIAEEPGTQDLRESIWSRYLGTDYIDLAFRTARMADPTAQLYLNEYDIEFAGDRFAAKRKALVGLIRALKDKGTPIDGVGIQGHLDPRFSIDTEALAALVGEIDAMGLRVMVTELDVKDQFLPADPATRDAITAKAVETFLQTVCAGVHRPTAVLTWGITDRYTWMRYYVKRADGLPNRPLPLDAGFRPKKMFAVIQRFAGQKASQLPQ